QAVFANRQVLDYESLEGRLRSSSYTPEEGHPRYLPMLDTLKRIFDAYQVEGRVNMEYDTRMYYGQLSPVEAPEG
ncbi:MAG: SAM-dependent methyltransferase, partial [Chloroflexi bacterium]|nr:SAM-dependent methyltransferase [Chloroflexota bacterium]